MKKIRRCGYKRKSSNKCADNLWPAHQRGFYLVVKPNSEPMLLADFICMGDAIAAAYLKLTDLCGEEN